MHLNGDDVAKLNHNQLRSVMNTLLTVEANEHGVLLADLVLNTRDTDPDAGIDARLQWPASAPQDPLHAGENSSNPVSSKPFETVETTFSWSATTMSPARATNIAKSSRGFAN